MYPCGTNAPNICIKKTLLSLLNTQNIFSFIELDFMMGWWCVENSTLQPIYFCFDEV